MANKVYVGDVGTDIILNCGEDVSSATVMKIKYQKPDQETGEWTAVLSGTDYIKYTVETDDLDLDGTWLVQAYVEMPSWSGHGETVEMEIYPLFG